MHVYRYKRMTILREIIITQFDCDKNCKITKKMKKKSQLCSYQWTKTVFILDRIITFYIIFSIITFDECIHLNFLYEIVLTFK